MQWDVRFDVPRISGRGYTFTLDGEPVEDVRAFDMERGVLVRMVRNGRGYPFIRDGEPDAATVTLYGRVGLIGPGPEREEPEQCWLSTSRGRCMLDAFHWGDCR